MAINKKIAVVVRQFPPFNTETYSVSDIKALENMGFEVTIFSPRDAATANPQDIISDHGLNAKIITLLPSRKATPPDRTEKEHLLDTDNSASLLEAVECYHERPQILRILVEDNPEYKPLEQAVEFLENHGLLDKSLCLFKHDMDSLEEKPYRKKERPTKFLQSLQLAHYMCTHDIHVAYANSFATSATLAQYATTIAGTGYVFGAQGHTNDIALLSESEVLAKLDATSFLTLSSPSALEILQRKSPECKTPVDIVYRPVDLKAFQGDITRVTRKTTSPQHPFKIVCCGRMIEKKGQWYLLEAIAKLPPHLNLEVILFGDGPLREQLEAYAKELHIESKVHFRGHTMREEMGIEIRDSDLLVVPSIIPKNGNGEGFPTVIPEAGTTQIPVLATDTAAAGVLTHNVNAYIVPQHNSQLLAQAIESLIENPIQREELGRNIKTFVDSTFEPSQCRQIVRERIEQAMKAAESARSAAVEESTSRLGIKYLIAKEQSGNRYRF